MKEPPERRSAAVDKPVIPAREPSEQDRAASMMPTLALPGGGVDKALQRTSGASLWTGNRVALLQNGPDTYDDWLAAIGRAERWVHLDNYIFQNDGVGRRFADALKEKAAEGVEVRVLHDWFGCLGVPRSFWREMGEAGVEVRKVNPLTLGAPLGVVGRDHRKLLAVDGVYASTGGVCISDGWMVRDRETDLPYRDTAVSVRGPVVDDLDQAFAVVWDETGTPLPDDERPSAEDIPRAGDTAARVVAQEPRRLRTLRMLDLMTTGVQRRLWITDAYFLSMPTLTQSLMAAAQDGVDVRVLVPATNDLPWIETLSRSGYRRFLEAGVRIFEYGGPMIHAKTLVSDGWWSKVGSTNLNFSSLAANWEIDLVVEDPGFASEMEAVFEKDLENAREVRLVSIAGDSKVRPERPINKSDRRSRSGPVGGGSGSAATLGRVSNAVLRKGDTPLESHEHAIVAAAGTVLVVASALGARFPRLVAWPMAAAGGLVGGLGATRAVRASVSQLRRGQA